MRISDWSSDVCSSDLAVRGSAVRMRVVVPRPAIGAGGAFVLERPASGRLQDLALRPAALPNPGAGEVRIAVTDTGLNFLDVMNPLGNYPGHRGPHGGDGAGLGSAGGDGVAGPEHGPPVEAAGVACLTRQG